MAVEITRSTDTDVAAHPLAWRLFVLLRDAPDADRRLVFETLTRRVMPVEADRPEVTALLECAKATGVTVDGPSVRQYDEWRRTVPAGRAAPSSGQIRRRFGSWRAAEEAVFARPAADPLRRRLGPARVAFTRDEAIAGLKRFVAENPDAAITQKTYLRWARLVRSQEDTQVARLPTSGEPFIRLFGSFTGAVAAAGIAVPNPLPGGASRRDHFAARSTKALEEFFAECGAPVTQPRYDQWRTRRATNRVLPIPPTTQTIVRTFGTWTTAVTVAAGAQAANHRHGRGREYTDEELLNGLRACTEDAGRRPTLSAYRDYRARRARAGEQLARPETIRVRLGLWAQAVDRALDDHDARSENRA